MLFLCWISLLKSSYPGIKRVHAPTNVAGSGEGNVCSIKYKEVVFVTQTLVSLVFLLKKITVKKKSDSAMFTSTEIHMSLLKKYDSVISLLSDQKIPYSTQNTRSNNRNSSIAVEAWCIELFFSQIF